VAFTRSLRMENAKASFAISARIAEGQRVVHGEQRNAQQSSGKSSSAGNGRKSSWEKMSVSPLAPSPNNSIQSLFPRKYTDHGQ